MVFLTTSNGHAETVGGNPGVSEPALLGLARVIRGAYP